MALLDRPGLSASTLIAVALSLLLSAILVLVGLVIFHAGNHPTAGNTTSWKSTVMRLSSPARVDIQARQYAFLKYNVSGIPATASLTLLWRTTEVPPKFHQRSLPPSRYSGTIALWTDNNWQGRIAQIGIFADTSSPIPTATVRLELSPYSTAQLLQTLWAEWTSPVARSHSTINYTRAVPKHAVLYPLPVIAAWLAISILAYTLISLARHTKPKIQVMALMVLLGWLILDMRWQSVLWQQLASTGEKYASKDFKEKLAAGDDAELYAYADRIKREFLPQTPTRLFILRVQDRGHDYMRLRAQYFLLPHNIYNLNRNIQKSNPKPGDFILLMGKVAGLRYSYATQQLIWDDGKYTVPAKRLDKDKMGTLYQVLQAPVSAAE